ncbi:MAG: helix-hairpin-helix domain-containing protein [Planctomycetota bacterium]|nr:MAG: helix-hairpin-helix domain-containing protein [Planctomycetota bacterium]
MVEQRIDPNIAHWWELARLPGIGEMRAKRIAAYRREQAAALQSGSNYTAILFFRLEDLDPIKGIGPKTLARMGPFLKFPSPRGQGAR